MADESKLTAEEIELADSVDTNSDYEESPEEKGAEVQKTDSDSSDVMSKLEKEDIKENTESDTKSNEEIAILTREIEKLRTLLDEKQREQEKILSELGEFSRLFPNVSVKDVPAEVWKKVEGGIPLSASYALYEREESLKRIHAEKINGINASLSAGMAGKNTPSEYYSAEEVKQMSPKEVHENYSKIKKSMKYWR